MFLELSLFASLFLSAFGILFVAVGWKTGEDVRAFHRDGTLRDAQVSEVRVSVRHTKGSRKVRSYEPVFAFADETGAEVERPHLVLSTAYDLPIGSTHRILTLPDHPKVLMADGIGARVAAITFCAFGLLALLLGLQGLAGLLGA